MSLVHLIDFIERGDDRGTLVAIEESSDIPFVIRRVYYVYDTGAGVRRGRHAHRDLLQVAVAVSGSCRFLLDDGHEKAEALLDRPNRGLLIGPMIWREMFDFSKDCVLMVLADLPYRESDYIRDYAEFLRLVAEAGS